MIHKLKALGLAFIAVFAMSAVIASAAQAGVFEAESYPVEITGSQITGTITGATVKKHEFRTTAGTVKCEEASFNGEEKAESGELTLKAKYGKCLIAGAIPATVNMKGCDYNFKAGSTIEASPDKVAVTAEVKCAVAGEEIEVTIPTLPNCIIRVPVQTLSGITAENTTTATPKMDVDAFVDVKETITYNIVGTECPIDETTGKAPPPGKYLTGSYTGVATLAGHKVGATEPAIGVTVT